MSDEISLWGPVTADTTAETVFTNSPGTVTVLESMTLANPVGGAATTVVLSLRTDGAATRVIEYPVPAGAGSYVAYPMLRITDDNILQLSSTVTDDVVVTTGNGYRESEAFSPLLIPEVAAGFFWDAELGVTDLGAPTFKWAEQNGRTAADQLQATAANQPALITNGGHNQFRYAVGAQTLTAGSVQAGWTGDTYIAGWFRFPDAPATGTFTQLLAHQTAATARRRLNLQFSSVVTDNNLQVTASYDGTNSTTIGVIHPDPTNWHFIECFLRPGNADVSIRRLIWIDGVLPTINNSTSATPFTTLNDPTEPLGLCSRAIPSTPNGQGVDCAWCVYTNGIPSDTNRARLYSYKRPA